MKINQKNKAIFFFGILSFNLFFTNLLSGEKIESKKLNKKYLDPVKKINIPSTFEQIDLFCKRVEAIIYFLTMNKEFLKNKNSNSLNLLKLIEADLELIKKNIYIANRKEQSVEFYEKYMNIESYCELEFGKYNYIVYKKNNINIPYDEQLEKIRKDTLFVMNRLEDPIIFDVD